MKKSALAVALCLAFSLGACGKGPKPLPPAPATPPPAAPATPPPAPTPPQPEPVQEDEYARLSKEAPDVLDRMGLFQDIRFDLDSAELRDADRQVLNENAAKLKKFDFIKVTVEGHCDERGSVEYNLALGERRSKAALDYLVSLGVAADRLKSVSYGKEVPVCQEHSEDCWARNRRAHFAVTGKVTR
jgi:peptidoglycan-associated lipoprotein